MPYEFSTVRYKEVVNFINALQKDISILDVGCGTGNVLEFIIRETGVKNVCGVDIDEEALCAARARGLRVFNLSILDDICGTLNEKFDVVILGAVLHHLVGRTRNESLQLSHKALLNATKLLKNGGYLIIVEPTFKPFWLLGAVFYVKRFFSLFTHSRVAVLNYWNNLGPPVVSYLTTQKLLQIAGEFKELSIVKKLQESNEVTFLMNLFFLKKYQVLLIYQKR